MRKLILDVFAESGQTFAKTERHDPLKNFNFRVEFVGKAKIHKTGWNQVSGVKGRRDFKEYREGGNNGVPDQIYLESRYEPITMRRGMSEDEDLLNLISKSFDKSGKGVLDSAKMDVVVSILDRDGKTVKRRFTLRDAWITAFETSDLDAMGTEVLFDIITLSFTGVDYGK